MSPNRRFATCLVDVAVRFDSAVYKIDFVEPDVNLTKVDKDLVTVMWDELHPQQKVVCWAVVASSW